MNSHHLLRRPSISSGENSCDGGRGRLAGSGAVGLSLPSAHRSCTGEDTAADDFCSGLASAADTAAAVQAGISLGEHPSI